MRREVVNLFSTEKGNALIIFMHGYWSDAIAVKIVFCLFFFYGRACATLKKINRHPNDLVKLRVTLFSKSKRTEYGREKKLRNPIAHDILT